MSINNTNAKKENQESKRIKKNTLNSKKDSNEKNFLKYLKYLITAITLLIVFYPPFLRGLYFGKELYPTEIIVFIAFLCFQIVKFLSNDKRFLRTPLDYISIAFIVVYGISIINAASIHLAIEEWLKYCMYFAVFSIITEIAKEIRNVFYILWTIVGSAVAVSLIGIDASANGIVIELINNVMESLKINYTIFEAIQGTRISSTLQYANALAAYLMAAFFVIMILILTSKKYVSSIVATISGFLVMTVFILTQSRGAYLIFPIVLLLFIVTLPKNRIIDSVVSIFGIAIPVAITSFLILKYISEPEIYGSKIWLVVLTGSVASAIISIYISKITYWVKAINWKVYAGIFAVITLIIILGSYYLVKSTEPLKLSHENSIEDSSITKYKSMSLDAGKNYRLVYEVEALAGIENPYAYKINLYGRNEKEILFNAKSLIASVSENKTTGIETREIQFSTPNDVKAVNIEFENFYKGTSVTFYKGHIEEITSGKIAKNLVMKYKYLPEVITSRFEGALLDKSSVQRSYYFTDGIKIFKDNWVIGAGGGAWEKLYTTYQSFTYNSTQAHNYFLQVIIETGILGAFVLLGFGSILIIMFIETKKRKINSSHERQTMQSALFAGIVALLVHSSLDFDLSLSAVALLLWEMAAIFNANYLLITNDRETVFKFKIINCKPMIVTSVTLILLLLPIMFSLAMKYGVAGSEAANNKDIKSALYYMLKAEGLDPWMPQYKIDSANLIYANKNSTSRDRAVAERMMVKAEKLSKNEAKLLPAIGSFYLMKGEIEHGLSFFDKCVDQIPFSPENWENRINIYYNVMLKYAEAGMQDKVNEFIEKIINIKQEAKDINSRNLNPFEFTAKALETLERVQYAKDFIFVKDSINLDKVILYETGIMDINLNNKLDGWSYAKDYTHTRKISLLPGKKYKIELALKDKNIVPSVPFTIGGVTDKQETLSLKGDIFYGEIVVPSTFKPGDNVLTLFIADVHADLINKVIIEEE